MSLITNVLGPIHCVRSTLKFTAQEMLSLKMAVKDYAELGYRSHVQCCREE